MEILSMYGLVITGTLTLIAIAILVKTLTAGKSRPPRHPYQKQIALFSPDDQVFHRALTDAVGENYVIFGKIRVADVIVPKKGTPRAEARRAFAPIAGRHFDFVLCEKHNLTVACTIQLTDKTNPARKPDLGNPIKAICEAVALPFASFHIQAEYPAEEMRERLRLAMSKEPFYMVETNGRREPHISNLDDMKF